MAVVQRKKASSGDEAFVGLLVAVARERTTPAYRPPGYEDFATFHPTYLYEFVWNLLAFAVIIWLDRRYRLGGGRVLALYVMGYTLGRGWIEMLRIDTVQMNNVLGLRLNVWTSIVLFVLATTYFISSQSAPSAYSEPLSRLDALYFSVTVFSTVGFGDIVPVSSLARVLTMAQMIGDVVVIGLVVRVMIAAMRQGLRRHGARSADI